MDILSCNLLGQIAKYVMVLLYSPISDNDHDEVSSLRQTQFVGFTKDLYTQGSLYRDPWVNTTGEEMNEMGFLCLPHRQL